MSAIVLVLRFRDLANPEPGTTIREHRELIAQCGHSWWAWWKKQTEQVPVVLWGELIAQIRREGAARAYLLDSGQRRLYATTVLEVRFDPAGALTSAPEDGAQTPAYYRQAPFATWFKLGPIVDVADADRDATLRALMFREAPHDDLVRFNKPAIVSSRLDSLDQLLGFNVTYWVATPATAETRPSVAIFTGPAPPALAPHDIIRAEGTRILHLSDLHLARGKHAFTLEHADAHNLSLAGAVYNALRSEPLPGIVVVTGDLTWTGAAAEFQLAYDCLDGLRSLLGLKPENFVIVPGNHDLQWTVLQQSGGDYRWDGHVEVAPAQAMANYKAFFERWYRTDADPWLSLGRRFFLLGGPTLDILGLNSSGLYQIKDQFAGLGRITDSAFGDSIQALGWQDIGAADWSRRPTDLRILALHHHLLPVQALERPDEAYRGFGVALDAETQLLRATRYGVDLVLHGHQHHPYVGYTVRESIIDTPIGPGQKALLLLGCGSTGVADAYLGFKQRCFNVIHVERERIHVELYSTGRAPDVFTKHAAVTARRHGQLGWLPWQRSEPT